MVTIACVVLSNLYSNFFSMYLFSEILGRKYCWKQTMVITSIYAIIGCVLRMSLFMQVGLNTVSFTSIYAYVTYILYVIAVFKSSVKKKILITTISMLVMILMELFAMSITTIVFGNFELMQLDSVFTILVCIISCLFITGGLLIWKWLWIIIEKIKWESFQYQWLCLFLPLSQWIMALYLTQVYILRSGNYPIVVLGGIGLGIIADIYMFYLFYCSNNRSKVERELRQVNHQYELEKIQYDRMQESQEEIAKIGHDFQNYILLVKRMRLDI